MNIGDRVRVRYNAAASGGALVTDEEIARYKYVVSSHASQLGTIVDPSEHPFDEGDGPLGGYDCIVRFDDGTTLRYNFHELVTDPTSTMDF